MSLICIAITLTRVYIAVTNSNQEYSQYEHSLTFRVRRYVVVATKPVHRLQIRPIVHKGTPYNSAKLHPGPCSSVGCGDGQTDRHRRPWPIYKVISRRLRLTRNVTRPCGGHSATHYRIAYVSRGRPICYGLLSVRLSVTSRCSLENAVWIGQVFSTDVTLDSSHTAL